MAKWRTIMFTLFILLISAMMVTAQDSTSPFVFCGDLPEADCAILEKSVEASDNLTAASFDFDVQLSISGTQVGGDQTVGITGSGAFSGRPAGMMANPPTDPMAMMGVFSDLLQNFKGDVSLEVTLPAMLTKMLERSADGAVPDTISLEVRLVDGIGYLNGETLAPFAAALGSELPPEFEGWIGVDLTRLFSSLIMNNPEMLSQLQVGGMGVGSDEMTEALKSLDVFKGAIKVERGADVDGAAVFTMSLDFSKLASDPAFGEFVRAQAESQGETISDEDLQKGMAMISEMGGALQFNSTQTIDTATGNVRTVTLNVAFDGSKLPTMGSTSSGMNDTTMKLDATFNIADFNDAPDITAPEDVTMAPESIYEMGKMGGMGSGAAPAEAVPPMTPTFTPAP
jgi:hypothetical protein